MKNKSLGQNSAAKVPTFHIMHSWLSEQSVGNWRLGHSAAIDRQDSRLVKVEILRILYNTSSLAS